MSFNVIEKQLGFILEIFMFSSYYTAHKVYNFFYIKGKKLSLDN